MEILILINSGIPYNKKSHPEMRSVFRYGSIFTEEFFSWYTSLFYIQSDPASLLLGISSGLYHRG